MKKFLSLLLLMGMLASVPMEAADSGSGKPWLKWLGIGTATAATATAGFLVVRKLAFPQRRAAREDSAASRPGTALPSSPREALGAATGTEAGAIAGDSREMKALVLFSGIHSRSCKRWFKESDGVREVDFDNEDGALCGDDLVWIADGSGTNHFDYADIWVSQNGGTTEEAKTKFKNWGYKEPKNLTIAAYTALPEILDRHFENLEALKSAIHDFANQYQASLNDENRGSQLSFMMGKIHGNKMTIVRAGDCRMLLERDGQDDPEQPLEPSFGEDNTALCSGKTNIEITTIDLESPAPVLSILGCTDGVYKNIPLLDGAERLSSDEFDAIKRPFKTKSDESGLIGARHLLEPREQQDRRAENRALYAPFRAAARARGGYQNLNATDIQQITRAQLDSLADTIDEETRLVASTFREGKRTKRDDMTLSFSVVRR